MKIIFMEILSLNYRAKYFYLNIPLGYKLYFSNSKNILSSTKLTYTKSVTDSTLSHVSNTYYKQMVFFLITDYYLILFTLETIQPALLHTSDITSVNEFTNPNIVMRFQIKLASNECKLNS